MTYETEFDPTLYAMGIAKKQKESALAEQQKRFDATKSAEVSIAIERKAKEKRVKYESHFGTFGKYILEVGTGGGFTAIPHAIDIYEGALGLSRDETWLMKRLCRYLPNIFPSMARIANEANTSESTLSRIKSGLVKKGFIRDNGKHSNEALQRDLNISPFFDALFLCVLCDPKSKIVVGQAMDKARTDYNEMNTSHRYAEHYQSLENFSFVDLPLSVDVAKKFAEVRGFTLGWNYIHEMQNGAALQELVEAQIDKVRMLEIKAVIKQETESHFGIVYNYGKTYEWLKWLCSTPVKISEVATLTAAYIEQAERPSAKEYMQWMRDILQSPENTKILTERGVREAAYV